MANTYLNARARWEVARKALACMTSIVLVVGLIPGVALAEDIGGQTTPVEVPYYDGTKTSNDVTVKGDIAVESDNASSALKVTADGPNTSATVNGSVSLKTGAGEEANAVNVKVNGDSDTVAKADIKGGVTAEKIDGAANITGVNVVVGDVDSCRGNAIVNVDGDVSVSTKVGGTWLYGVETNVGVDKANVTVGNVTVEDKSPNAGPYSSFTRGIGVLDTAGAVTTAKAGKVTATGAAQSEGVYVCNANSDDTAGSTVTVGSMVVEGAGIATGLDAIAYNNGSMTIIVSGDCKVTATDSSDGQAYGVWAVHDQNDDYPAPAGGDIRVLVDGTLSVNGEQSVGIVHNTRGVVTGCFDATVWKIVVGAGGYVAAKTIEIGSDAVLSEDVDLESAIDYIVKFEQPSQGSILSLSGTKKKNIVTQDAIYTYDVANWGNTVNNKVYLKAAEGWVITGGFSDKEKTVALQHDENGWYAVVPNGGGLYLTAQVAKQQFDVTFKNGDEVLQSSKVNYGDMPEYTGATPTKDPAVDVTYEFAGWKPVLDKVTGDIVYEATFTEKTREYEMSFDLDGGTVDGKTGKVTIKAAYGSTITLLSPTREGYVFQYWKGSRYDAGASYKIEGPHTFKAVWKKKSEPKPDPKPDPKPKPTPTPDPTPSDKSSSASTTMPATGDTMPVLPILATLLLSAAALAASYRKLQPVRPSSRGKHVR